MQCISTSLEYIPS